MSTDTGGPQRYAKVKAATGRAGWSKTAEHTATVGHVEGRGTSQAAALDNLAALLAGMAERNGADPALWWDADNRVLFIAVTDVVDGGHRAVTVDMSGDKPRISCTSSGTADAYHAFDSAVGMTAVTR
jgi:hypothetical protein